MKILCMLMILLLALPAFAQADDFVLNGRDLPAALEQIPEGYFHPCDTPGTMVRLDYDTWESFSYGSVTTWRTFEHCLPYFRYFMPMSGSLTTNAAYMDAIVRSYGYDWNDYFLFTASGTADFAYSAFKRQVDNMAASDSGYFRMADNEVEGSIAYRELEGATHSGSAMMVYVYNGLCWFWNP